MAGGLADLGRTARNPSLIFFMAWGDVRARYKRSVLGPLWMTLSTAIGVVGLGFIWSELFHQERSVYVPMLSLGLILWQFISSSVSEAATVFVRQANLIRNVNLPISFHPAQLLLRQLINLAHTLPLYFVVVLALGSSLTLNALWAIPALVLVFLNMFWIILLISILGARFRDLDYLITMILPLLMFFTPVLYRPDALPFSAQFIWLNPIAYMIEIVRAPLLGEGLPVRALIGNAFMLVVGASFTLYLFNKKRDRVAMWV